MSENPLLQIQQELAEFARERDWDQFHSPKNLAMALSVEAGELVEIFQWLTEAQSFSLNDKTRNAVAEEMADVFIYLLRFADKVGIDILDAVKSKIVINQQKYPADLVRGKSHKYTEYKDR